MYIMLNRILWLEYPSIEVMNDYYLCKVADTRQGRPTDRSRTAVV